MGSFTTFGVIPIFKAVVKSGNQFDLGHYLFVGLSATTLVHPIYILTVFLNRKSNQDVNDNLLQSWLSWKAVPNYVFEKINKKTRSYLFLVRKNTWRIIEYSPMITVAEKFLWYKIFPSRRNLNQTAISSLPLLKVIITCK